MSSTGKRWERDKDLVPICHQTFASRASLGSSRLSNVCLVVPTVAELTLPFLAHKPDANRHLHRRSLFRLWLNTLGVCSRDRAPLHLQLAGPVRQLADADVQAVFPQRPADEGPATASYFADCL